MITIERISHFAAAVVTRATDTRLVHWLTLRCSPVWHGDIKVFSFVAPSSDDGCLPVMCESRNFESIFRPPAILHPRSRPRPQLQVSPSCRLRHVTKPTVTYMTDFLFCLRCHFSILEFWFANAVTSLLLTCVATVVDPRFKLIAFELKRKDIYRQNYVKLFGGPWPSSPSLPCPHELWIH